MSEKVEIVEGHRDEHGLNRCCRALGLSKSSYYWAQRPDEPDEDDERLKDELVEIIGDHPGYGRRRLTPELCDRLEERINEKRVRRILEEYDLALARCLPKARPSKIRETLSQHRSKIDLVTGRELDPLEAFSTDFTEIFYADGTRKAYLIALIDIVSKWVPGWALGPSGNTDLALECWDKVKENLSRFLDTVAGVYVHGDLDSVFTSGRWVRTLLVEDKARLSYSTNGARDNPWIESFWGRLKVENRSLFNEAQTLSELSRLVDDRLVYHNERRGHSALQNQPPIVFLQDQFTRRGGASEESP